MGSVPKPLPVNDKVQQVLLGILIAFAVYIMTQFMSDHDTLTRHGVSLKQMEDSQSAIVTELREIRNILQKQKP